MSSLVGESKHNTGILLKLLFPTQGEKKRNLAWRPLPKSILSRVCELAVMYPYPKGQRAKVSRVDSPDTSTDITLSDYRRILRTINAN